MTTPSNSHFIVKSSEAFLEDDLQGIYQQLQDIAETVILPSDETKFTQNLDDNNFNEIEGFYKEIDQKEKQVKILVEISTSLLTKTKEKIINKEQEIKFIKQNVDILENDLSQGKERMNESNDIINSLNNQKDQLESYLNDLETGYEKTQDNLFRSQEEFISLGEYKRKFQELNSLLDQNNDLLSFYKQTNEDLRREYKFSKTELGNCKVEVEGMRKRLTLLLENYEKSIHKQTNLNKQKLVLQDQISKIKDEIKNIQQLNSVLIKEIERDQLKRIKGVTKISSVGFLQGLKETPKNIHTLKNQLISKTKNEIFDDKMSIDLLIETEEKEKSQENIKTPQLLKKCENIEEKDKTLCENNKNDAKANDFTYENFTSFKNALEINVVSQKSEEFTLESEGPKYFKTVKLNSSRNGREDFYPLGGLMNFWMVGGLTVLFTVILVLKTQIKNK